MKKLFQRVFPSEDATQPVPPVPADESLRLKNEAQALRMELEARDDQIARLSQEVERLRDRQERLTAETASARLEALLAEAAAPSSQIITQADLLERQGRPVQAKDILMVARRLVRALEAHGLVLEGSPGEQVAFDPARHAPLSGSHPEEGQFVTVRFAGVTYQRKTLYKAIVEQEMNARSSGS